MSLRACDVEPPLGIAAAHRRTPPLPALHREPAPPPLRPLSIEWARSEDDVREAQRLRYRVFALEMGARLPQAAGTAEGLDVDRFDAFCDHLLVRAGRGCHDARGDIVGTYRVLSPAGARAAGGFYTDTEFDLAPLAALRQRTVELGRSCVHADWRSGSVILAMWSALAAYMLRSRLDTMIGCASVSLAQGVAPVAALWQDLRGRYLADARWHVQPLHGVPGATLAMAGGPAACAPSEAPPLLKGYLRCGARLLGPPALDEAFNTADLPIMLRLDDMAPRYRRHLLASA
ncbi:GNAT family N-acetyltransferase [Ramlibacter sp. MMS24-I3-19]|uniref:GNAT family N-acetyltransferase n=1 Tax=Ramlibacter sp. MMS24-I3-19 TaxID=3416606 RepID=UPI003D02F4E5